jgi:hypothetical protein
MTTAKSFPLIALSFILMVYSHHAPAQSGVSGQYGPDPKLPEPHRGLLPTMKIANPKSNLGRRKVIR